MSSFIDDLRGSLRQSADGIRGSFSGIGTGGIRGLPGRTMGWFRGLSGIPKLALVGVALLVLLVVLSPVVMVVAVLLFGVSVIALMIRVAQKGSLKNWGLVAVASVVMLFTFGGISGALYGIGFGGSSPSGSGGSGGETDTATDEVITNSNFVDVVENPYSYKGTSVVVSGDRVGNVWNASEGALFMFWVNDDVKQTAWVVVPDDSAEEILYYTQGGRATVKGTIIQPLETENTTTIQIRADVVEGE